jgi:hypothetical protein
VLAGDVVRNMDWLRGPGHVKEPPAFFSADVERNRESMRLLVGLRPRLVLCGHGPPIRDMRALEDRVRRLGRG